MAKYKALKMPPKKSPDETDAELMNDFTEEETEGLPTEKRDADVEMPFEDGIDSTPAGINMEEVSDDDLLAEFKKRGLEKKLEEAPEMPMEEESSEEFPV